MTARKSPVRSSALPTKRLRSPTGEIIRMKVVNADSETLGEDLLAAFRSNVRGLIEARRKRANANNTA